MDFLKGTQQNQTAHTATVSEHSGGRRGKKDRGGFLKWITVALLFALTILVVLVIVKISIAQPKSEEGFIDKGKMQAVFLNNGQVYFGKIKTLNENYLQVQNIYYLRVNQTVQPNQSSKNANNDVSLVKLGCELHGPVDQMLINRDQVTFWENLKTDGQVAKAVDDYVKANPNGQQCNTSSSNSSGNNSTTKDNQ